MVQQFNSNNAAKENGKIMQ